MREWRWSCVQWMNYNAIYVQIRLLLLDMPWHAKGYYSTGNKVNHTVCTWFMFLIGFIKEEQVKQSYYSNLKDLKTNI